MERALQVIFQKGWGEYSQGRKLPLHYHKAAHWIKSCRTKRLGGHANYCENGHLQDVQYNSCHSRSCPQCNGLIKARWLENQQSQLLACNHRHLVFTIDHELNALWRCNRRRLSDLLFQAVQEVLKAFLHDSRYLGATPGFILGLHTWDRQLGLHPHIHCLVTEGGLASNGDWISPRSDYFLPARALMPKFRGKYLSLIRQCIENQSLKLPTGIRSQQQLNRINKMGRKKWNVRVETRYAHGNGVAHYLARYLRGGPVSNRQLSCDGDRVMLRPKRRPQERSQKNVFLTLNQFLSRYLQHLPEPARCVIRRYGLYSPSQRKSLNWARKACGQAPVVKQTQVLTVETYIRQVTGSYLENIVHAEILEIDPKKADQRLQFLVG